MTRDTDIFGIGSWIYCKQHLRPHMTGWCSVNVDEKVRLDAKTSEGAYAECRRKGFHIYDDESPVAERSA